MKNIILILSILSISISANSQNKSRTITGPGSIQGIIIEENGGNALEFVSVALYKKPSAKSLSGNKKITPEMIKRMQTDTLFKDSLRNAAMEAAKKAKPKIVSGSITNARGKFYLENLPYGEYLIKITSLGYESQTIDSLNITRNRMSLYLGKILMIKQVLELDEISVEEQKSLYENKIDKMIYNAETDESNKTGTCEDVLRKVPMLSVGLDGEVLLRGSSSIKILVNGKPSALFSNNLQEALTMIPASEIKRVEVITSPTAKYDGEGAAGIVNIVTKKKGLEGFFASGNLNFDYFRPSTGFSFNQKKGRLSTHGSIGISKSFPRNATSDYYREDYINGMTRKLSQTGISNREHVGAYGSGGLEFEFNESSSINSSLNFHKFDMNRTTNTQIYYSDPIYLLEQEYMRTNIGETESNSIDWNTDYLKKFKKEGQELFIAFQYNNRDRNEYTKNTQTANDENYLFYPEYNYNLGNNTEYTGSIDYTHPFTEKIKLETGLKSINRNFISDYGLQQEDSLSNIENTSSDILDYKQNVYSVYSSLSFNLVKDIGIITGLRYEKTSITGNYISRLSNFSNSYDNYMPNLIISKNFKNFSSVKLSYNNRISRPSMYYLSPYENSNDKLNIKKGNPNLKPETSHKFELSYNTFIKKKIMVNTSAYYRTTTDEIQPITSITEEGVSETIYENLGTNKTVGLNIFSNYRLGKKFNFNASLNFYMQEITAIENGIELKNSGFAYSGNIGAFATLKHGFKINTYLYFKPSRITIQGDRSGFVFTRIGASKTVLKEKGTIGLSIRNPFMEYLTFKTNTEGDNFIQTYDYNRPFRSVGLTFSYKIGKLNIKKQKRRRGISNDDMKSEGGNNGE